MFNLNLIFGKTVLQRILIAAAGFTAIPFLALVTQKTALIQLEDQARLAIPEGTFWLLIGVAMVAVSGMAFLTREMAIDHDLGDETPARSTTIETKDSAVPIGPTPAQAALSTVPQAETARAA